MALKGQSNNQLNLNPKVIDEQNDFMLESLNELLKNKEQMDTQCQEFISCFECDIKHTYERLYGLIEQRNIFSENNLNNRICKNKNFVSDMKKTQIK